MATSADTLLQIIDAIARENALDVPAIKEMLNEKGLLPKKLLASPKSPKALSPWASKAAEELAKQHSISPEGLTGSGTNDKITIKDVKTFLNAPIKKVKASAPALKFARDNGVDLSKIASGSGQGGTILLKDVKDLSAGSSSDSSTDEDGPILSPAAKQLCDKWHFDDEDLDKIKGTGSDGKILAKDLAELVKECEAEEE